MAGHRPEDARSGRTAWVIGSSGMLGSAVVRRLRVLGRDVVTTRVPWHDHDAAVEALLAASRDLPDEGWELFWCAGAAVTASSQADVDAEVAVFEELLSEWQPSNAERAGIFLASSAGGLYAGAHGAPFTEHTEPAPISAYGRAKLRMEDLVTEFAQRADVAVLVGRLANLYGPGQDLAKPQGLVSQLCRAELTRRPLTVYVSTDTRRDYLYIDDAAAMVVAATGQVIDHGVRALKVLASEHSTTVGAIVSDLRRITRRRPPVVFGTSPTAPLQAIDLRLRSVAWPHVSGAARTPLGAGMAATLDSLRGHVAVLPR